MSSSGIGLEEDLNWREAELASLELLASEVQRGTPAHSGLLRALRALLYAHYEGFCRFAWEHYLDEIRATNVIRNQCADPIAILSLTKEFKRIAGSGKASELWAFCREEFQQRMAECVDFKFWFESNSNLPPRILVEEFLFSRLELLEGGHPRSRAQVARRPAERNRPWAKGDGLDSR